MRRALLYSRSYGNAVLNSPGLIGYWRLGEASGTVAAGEMGANNGTYVNSPTLGVAGLLAGDPNTAVTFAAASSHYVGLGNSASLDVDKDVSVFAWIKTAVTPAAFGTILIRRAADHAGYWLSVDDTGKLNGFIGAVADWVGPAPISAVSVCDGATHMVGMTRAAGGDLLGYVDGVQVGSTAASAFTLSMTGTGNAAIGVWQDVAAFYFDGTADEPAIWNRALSAGEVARFYQIGRGY